VTFQVLNLKLQKKRVLSKVSTDEKKLENKFKSQIGLVYSTASHITQSWFTRSTTADGAMVEASQRTGSTANYGSAKYSIVLYSVEITHSYSAVI